MKQWSTELREITRDILYNMPVDSFTFNPEGCSLKNIDGRFGYITLNDALAERYIVHIRDNNISEQEDFQAIDALIDAGWAVD